MNDVVFKTLKTAGGRYVYDRSRNTVLKVTDKEYEELCEIERGSIAQSDSEVLKKYQDQDFLKPNTIEKIEHPCTSMLGHYLLNHMEQLTLQVTQRCNLRCRYCTYGGFFDNNRTHSNIDMSYEDAIKAIDFYLSRSAEAKRATFGFYGGEPLLKFDLIQKCVNYIKSKVSKEKELFFTITTNGTLLTRDIAQFLFDNNFSILISLDGSKKEHDEYRVFPDGSGSFEIIMNNLKSIQKLYPELFKKVQFNTVLNPNHDYKHLKAFFEEDELLGSANVLMTLVNTNSVEGAKFGDEFYRSKEFDRFKLYLWALGKLDVKYVQRTDMIDYLRIKQDYDILSTNSDIASVAHHSGPCIPGGRRVLVNVHGEIFPCERVNEVSDVMKIGHLNSGFDLEKADNLLNVGRVTEEECKNCWALFYCGLCCKNADGGNELCGKTKLKYCQRSKEDAYFSLAQICALNEMGCVFNEKGVLYENPLLPDNV